MTIQDRIQDIGNTNLFNDEELCEARNDSYISCFHSWEFYQIFHVTNEELYYLDGDTENDLTNSADEVIDTEKGRIYCFS